MIFTWRKQPWSGTFCSFRSAHAGGRLGSSLKHWVICSCYGVPNCFCNWFCCVDTPAAHVSERTLNICNWSAWSQNGYVMYGCVRCSFKVRSRSSVHNLQPKCCSTLMLSIVNNHNYACQHSEAGKQIQAEMLHKQHRNWSMLRSCNKPLIMAHARFQIIKRLLQLRC